MIRISTIKLVSDGFKSFFNNLERYKHLTHDDKKKLLFQLDLQDVPQDLVSEINEKLELPYRTSKNEERENVGEFDHLTFIKRELNRLKSSPHKSKRILGRDSILKGPSKIFMGIDPTKELDPIDIKSPLFSTENETESLVSDIKKASKYEVVQQILEESRPVPQHVLTDNFLDIASRAIEENLLNLEPVLVNEPSEYRVSYTMKRAAVRNLLLNRCIRNAFEESRVEKFLDSQKSLYNQRLNSPLPPEVLEPLVAFRGDVYYSFSHLKRLQDKLDGINILIDSLSRGLFSNFIELIGENKVFSNLPEFCSKTNYPFKNYYGFKSSVPNEVTGSIRMGKASNEEDLRYPNLQCVAHSLPKDKKYRAIVTHSIKVLERAKGWDHNSKVNAINKLINVYNNMSSSHYYSKMMEHSVPTDESKGKVVKTLSRQQVFNKGLKYIPSLFRNHWNRTKRK